jgi:4-aminobutyrate aminotransferase-like enzyme
MRSLQVSRMLPWRNRVKRRPVLRIAPPLCIKTAEVDELVGIAADSIDALERDIAG